MDKKDNKKHINMIKQLIPFLAGLAIGLTILIIVLGIQNSWFSNKENITSSEIELTSEQQEKFKIRMVELLNKLKSTTTYIQVHTDEETCGTYMYNSKGEVVVEDASGNMKIFRNDGAVAVFDDYIYLAEDVDLLSMIINALNLIGQDNVELHGVSEDNEESITKYILYLRNWDTIRLIYQGLSDDTIAEYINNFKYYLGDDWEPCMTFEIAIDDEDGLYIQNSFIHSDTKYINWYFDGYMYMDDWSLSKGWYESKFNDAAEAEQLLTFLLDDLEKVIQDYIDVHTSEENTATK